MSEFRRLPIATASAGSFLAQTRQARDQAQAVLESLQVTPVRSYAGNRVLAEEDLSALLRFTNASAAVVTVPSEAQLNAAVGTQVAILRAGSGVLTVSPGAGVTLVSPDGADELALEGSAAVLIKIDSDEWTLQGDII